MTRPESPSDGTDRTSDDGSGTRISRRQFAAGAGTALATLAAGTGAAAVGGAAGRQSNGDSSRSVTVRLENVADGETLSTSADGEMASQPVPLSPLVYAVHTRDEPIFSPGEPERDNGLEEVAEDGSPGKLVEHLSARDTAVDAGAVAVPNDADEPGPLTPGHSYEFSTEAAAGSPRRYLSLVTMFVPSNDLFYALGGASGMPLFDGESPTAGNATEHVGLWDAGTEINQEPGVGDHQVQRQRAAGVGDVERGTVARVSEVNGYEYPAVSDVLRLRVTPN